MYFDSIVPSELGYCQAKVRPSWSSGPCGEEEKRREGVVLRHVVAAGAPARGALHLLVEFAAWMGFSHCAFMNEDGVVPLRTLTWPPVMFQVGMTFCGSPHASGDRVGDAASRLNARNDKY